MINFSEMPALPGASSRPATVVAAGDLNSVGVSISAYAMHAGDRVTFDVLDDGNPLVVKQEVRKDSGTYAYYVACTRNGKKSWLSISYLTRRDKDQNYVNPIGAELSAYANFGDMFATGLKNKTIVGGDLQPFKMTKFENGQVVDGEIIRQMSPASWA